MRRSILSVLAFLALASTGFGSAITNELVIGLTSKEVVSTNTIAIRENIPVRLINIGISDPTNLVLRITDVDGVTYALTEGFEDGGTVTVGVDTYNVARGFIDLNTSEFTGFYSNAPPFFAFNFVLGLWDVSLNRLLVSDEIRIQNNPYQDGMPGPSPIGVHYITLATNSPEPEIGFMLQYVGGGLWAAFENTNLLSVGDSGVWGNISGTLSDQVDLWSHLAGVVNSNWFVSLHSTVMDIINYVSNRTDTAYGWGDHASAGYADAEDSLLTKTTKVDNIEAGATKRVVINGNSVEDALIVKGLGTGGEVFKVSELGSGLFHQWNQFARLLVTNYSGLANSIALYVYNDVTPSRPNGFQFVGDSYFYATFSDFISNDPIASMTEANGFKVGGFSWHMELSGDVWQDKTNSAGFGNAYFYGPLRGGHWSTNSVSETNVFFAMRPAVGDTNSSDSVALVSDLNSSNEPLWTGIGSVSNASDAADAALWSGLGVVSVLVDNVESDIASANTDIGAVSNASDAADTALWSGLGVVSVLVDNVESDIASANTDIGAVSNASDAADTALWSGLGVVSVLVDNVESDIASANTDIGAVSNASDAADSALWSGIGVVSVLVDNVESDIASANTDIGAVSNASDAADTALWSGLGVVSVLVDNVESDIASANTDIGAVSNASDAADAALWSGIGVVSTLVDNVESGVSSANTDIGSVSNASDAADAALWAGVGVVSNQAAGTENTVSNLHDFVHGTNVSANTLRGTPPNSFVTYLEWQAELTNQLRYVSTFPTNSSANGAVFEWSSQYVGGGTNEISVYLHNGRGSNTAGWVFWEVYTK